MNESETERSAPSVASGAAPTKGDRAAQSPRVASPAAILPERAQFEASWESPSGLGEALFDERELKQPPELSLIHI